MKSSLILFLLLIGSKSMALTLGGVDVGNGHVTPSMITTNSFDSEEELIEFAETLLTSINYGVDPIILQLASDGECSLDKYKFRKMKIRESYTAPKANRFSKKKFIGRIIVDFYDCQQPDFIHYNDPDELANN